MNSEVKSNFEDVDKTIKRMESTRAKLPEKYVNTPALKMTKQAEQVPEEKSPEVVKDKDYPESQSQSVKEALQLLDSMFEEKDKSLLDTYSGIEKIIDDEWNEIFQKGLKSKGLDIFYYDLGGGSGPRIKFSTVDSLDTDNQEIYVKEYQEEPVKIKRGDFYGTGISISEAYKRERQLVIKELINKLSSEKEFYEPVFVRDFTNYNPELADKLEKIVESAKTILRGQEADIESLKKELVGKEFTTLESVWDPVERKSKKITFKKKIVDFEIDKDREIFIMKTDQDFQYEDPTKDQPIEDELLFESRIDKNIFRILERSFARWELSSRSEGQPVLLRNEGKERNLIGIVRNVNQNEDLDVTMLDIEFPFDLPYYNKDGSIKLNIRMGAEKILAIGTDEIKKFFKANLFSSSAEH